VISEEHGPGLIRDLLIMKRETAEKSGIKRQRRAIEIPEQDRIPKQVLRSTKQGW